ncbi:RDD family protein [Undibacterium curvum]|uniref:RDD family protein n=1 Tax=Undibacterium curvum TaxID=2762294 RepID=A0ABR6ZZT0_9BURK|nr:RDD family protein [Undibacterium curvum]MBC3930179.1 RDD family protein [Undibacterium curvum]
MDYAGFWRRLGAYLVDLVCLLPLIGINYYLGSHFRLFYLYWFLPELIIGVWFSVYLVYKYGGTPGKLLLKTRIAMVDGSPVTAKAAIVRHSVLFIFSTLSSIAMVYACLQLSDAEYLSLTYMQQAEKLEELAPSWYGINIILMNIWVWGEFFTMLFNKKRRAAHDFLAGTVVINTALNNTAVSN